MTTVKSVGLIGVASLLVYVTSCLSHARAPLVDTAPHEIASRTLPGLKLVRMTAKGKSFTMGSPKTEEGRKDNETEHKVQFSADYYLGVTDVTRGQFAVFVKAMNYETDAEKGKDKDTWRSPGFAQTDDDPVVCVSWNDAAAFCRWLSSKDNRTYRLPTEAEWEYGCRAGTAATYSFGDDALKLGDYAWYGDNAEKRTHPVGKKKPNGWGLFDTHGNVWQWCGDVFGDFSDEPVSDPKGPLEGSDRVVRGGGWSNDALSCRSAHRRGVNPSYRVNSLGFRIAVTG